jgi:phosphatidylglycerophosphatase C
MFILGLINNARLKEYFLTAFLGGATQEQIQQWSSTFVVKLLKHGMRGQGLKVLKAHITSGDHTVLLSASLDFYVTKLGAHLGFHQVVCTRAEWRDNRLTGRLASPNYRGQEKVRQLELLRSRFPNTYISAYADNDSDLELLSAVDNGVLINASRKTRAKAISLNISRQYWKC